MASSPPLSLGRYVLHRELASGGMAAVFFGRLLGPSGFSRTVAIKRPHKHLMSDRDFAMMFIDEARLASRIRHTNVVSTLDVIETADELALVMDYVHGESLSRLSAASRDRGERVPLPIAAAILIDTLHGLHAAHEATDEESRPLGIVHRDISPQNLLVGADGITRIADFGIAKAAGRLLTTRDGSIKGKYAYMAPEQIRGKAVTRQTDVFAASIVLWELLTGEGLFRGANEGEEIYKCLEGVVEAPSRRDPKVPAAFDAIVLRGLQREPGDRYPTAREMAADIERAISAVRPSEIAAWVEGLAGATLAARAEVISEMERTARTSEQDALPRTLGASLERTPSGSHPSGSDAGSDKGAPKQGGSNPSGASLAVSASGVSAPGVNVTFTDSQVSHAGVVAERRPHPPAPSGSRALLLAAFGAVVIALAVGAYAFSKIAQQSTLRSAAGVDAALPPAGEPLTSAAAAAPVPSASAEAVAAPVTAPVTAPRAAGSAAAPAANGTPPPPAGSATPNGKAGAHPSKQTKSGSCDPPYIVDAQGREVFKLQCL